MPDRGFQGLRQLPEDGLHIGRQAAIGGVQVSHRQQMFEDVFRQAASAQFFSPRLDRHIDICDRPSQRLAVLSGVSMQIGRPWSGQFVNLADVPRRIEQDRERAPSV